VEVVRILGYYIDELKSEITMLSRVANSIYWMGRYLERAENYSRFMDVNFNLMLDLPPQQKAQWEPLIYTTGDQDQYLQRYQGFSMKDVVHFMTFDRQNPNSILNSISQARENARSIRESLIKETWEKLNQLFHYVSNMAQSEDLLIKDPRSFYYGIRDQVLLIYGLGYATVSRNEAWHFRQLGVFLERADKTSRIVDAKYHVILPSPVLVGSPIDSLHWSALLKSVSGFNIYRKQHGILHPPKVVDFLMLDKMFPRSVFYGVLEAENCLRLISGNKDRGYFNDAEKYIGELRSMMEFTNVEEIIYKGLHQYIDHIQSKLNQVANEINESYF
jgi:uncharacterized alpha-E superfamily protein